MLSIGNKTFLNLQEAVGWLLQNNALPFQSTANYVANTEIAKSTIINPSPAEVKVGSLVLFADSKVGTVSGITSNGFIVGPDYTDIVSSLNQIVGIALNASGHLIVTLTDGTTIDSGLVKQISNFSINASQHLIANYNDGTNTDLGAIFTGNVTISGTLTANSITGNSIIEIMSGYSFTPDGSLASNGITLKYVGVCKNGNKVTFAIAGEFDATHTPSAYPDLGFFTIPSELGTLLVPLTGSYLDYKEALFVASWSTSASKIGFFSKDNNQKISSKLIGMNSGFDGSSTYAFRLESTFLLSPNLVS